MKHIFDIEKIRANRTHAFVAMGGHDFLFKDMTNRLIDNLSDIKRDFSDILIIGARGASPIANYFSGKNVTIYDVINGGSEIPDFEPEQFDCIIALGYMHVVNDVKGFLTAIKSYLKPDGLFLNSFFGGHSLQELRTSIMQVELAARDGASNHIHPMIDHYQFAGLMQGAGFALPVVDYDVTRVEYSDLNKLYADLKNMGEGNALMNREATLSGLGHAIELFYKAHFYNQGFVATFEILHGIGWKYHESQQKPATRGSGQISLEEIL